MNDEEIFFSLEPTLVMINLNDIIYTLSGDDVTNNVINFFVKENHLKHFTKYMD